MKCVEHMVAMSCLLSFISGILANNNFKRVTSIVVICLIYNLEASCSDYVNYLVYEWHLERFHAGLHYKTKL